MPVSRPKPNAIELLNYKDTEFKDCIPLADSQLVNMNGNPITIDTITRALTTIDYAHHEIHSGSHYNYLDTHDLIKNGTIDHMIVTPDTDVFAHLSISVYSTTSTVLISMFEDTTYSDPGSVEPMINRNRNFPDNNTTILYEEPTIISDGTRIARVTIGAGKNSDGGGRRDDNEIVLRKNTAYLIRVTELNIAATTIDLNFDWYEHQNKTD